MLKRKKLSDVKTGDLLVDEDGRATRVDAVTGEEEDGEIFKITLVNNLGVKSCYNATASHVWPLDASASGSLPENAEGESEATTMDIAGWVGLGYHPVLSPIMSNGVSIRWTVASCVMLSDEEASKIRTKCVKVDSPTHTFMLASESIRKNADGKSTKTKMPTSDGRWIEVCADDLREVMTTSAPTHNCGGPLTLDTEIPLFSGGVTTMGEVRTGETLIGSGNRPVRVTQVSQVMEPDDLSELEFMED